MKKPKCEKCAEKLYCSYCGKQMTLTLKVHTNYDNHTGEKVDLHYHIFKCPSAWGLGIFTHDRFYDFPQGAF